MNKYTLNFVEKEFECQYQKETIENIRKIIFYIFTSYLLIQSIIILGVNNQLPTIFLVYSIGVLGLSTISIILGYFRIVNMQFLLILCNFSFMLIQITANTMLSIQAVYNSGSNMMIIHCVIISVCDFPQSVFQIVVIYFFKIFMLSYLGNFMIDQTISMGMLAAIQIFNSYRQIKVNRIQFQLRFSSIKWDQLLPKVIEKRYLYFTFNQFKTQFKFAQSNFCENSEEFLIFLRNNKVKNETLENYIFHNIKQIVTEVKQTTVNLVNSSKESPILLTEFYLEDPSFIIILDQEQSFYQNHGEQIKQIQNKFRSTLQKILENNMKKLHRGLEKNNLKMLFHFRFSLFIQILKKHQTEIKQIMIYQQIQFIMKLLNKSIKLGHVKCHNVKITTQTIVPSFQLMIIHVLRNFKAISSFHIIDNEIQNYQILLKIQGALIKSQLQLSQYQDIIENYQIQYDNQEFILNIWLKSDFSFINKIDQIGKEM